MNYRLQSYVGTVMGIQGSPSVSQDAVDPIRWVPAVDSGFEILIEDGHDRGKTLSLSDTVLLLGREDLPGEKRPGWMLFGDRSVSRRQALMWWNVPEQEYTIVHVDSATNQTLVDHHAFQSSALKSGQHVKFGHLGFRVHKRPLVRPNNPLVRSAIQVVGESHDTEQWVDTRGLALTIVEGDGQGQTWLLNKNYHLLGARTRTRNSSLGGNLCLPDAVLSPEQAVLIWVESARSYAVVPYRLANMSTWISHASSDSRTFPDPYEEPVVLQADHPMYVHPGDIIGVGNLKLLVHQEIGDILAGAVSGLLRGDWPSWAMGFSAPGPLERAAPTAVAPSDAPFDYEQPNSETVRWTPTADWFVQIIQGTQSLPEIPIMTTTLANGRTLVIGGPGGSSSDIMLEDGTLPNALARLEYQGSSWQIIPENSGTPIFVKSQPLRDRRTLQANEEVAIGRYRLRLVYRPQRNPNAPPPAQFALDIMSAPGYSGGGRLLLERPEAILGRDKGCDLVFNDATVSRRHAAVVVHNHRVWLRPLSNTNPTFVNGVQVQQNRALEHGDEVQLSRDSSVRFVDLKEEVF